MKGIDSVIAIAENEIGYLEKATVADLDDKTANAGSNNYTKYARDLYAVKYFNGNKQGAAWCATFVSWCFYTAFGKELALKLQCQPSTGNCGAGCTSATNYYKNKKQFYNYPEAGDQIFFYTGGTSNIGHTGLVVGVDANYVYTIEGNTSGGSEVIPNGGGVCKKKYALNNAKIVGYGRPDYSLVAEQEKEMENMVEGIVTATSGKTVNLRSKPDSNSFVSVAVPIGATIHYEDWDATWCKVEYNGTVGYMMKKFIAEVGTGSDNFVLVKLPKELAGALLAALEAAGV